MSNFKLLRLTEASLLLIFWILTIATKKSCWNFIFWDSAALYESNWIRYFSHHPSEKTIYIRVHTKENLKKSKPIMTNSMVWQSNSDQKSWWNWICQASQSIKLMKTICLLLLEHNNISADLYRRQSLITLKPSENSDQLSQVSDFPIVKHIQSIL